ncbi:MAG TPA: HEAT repeat domain-containing protein [Kofleriaceae bacterium]|nr:HEAT repeat domain-containing protein [Kofleriaceae bacterium]
MTRLAFLLAFSVAVAPGCRRGGAGRARDGGPGAAGAPAARSDAGPARRAPETAVIGDLALRRVDPPGNKVEMKDEDLAGALGSVLAGSRAFAASEAEVPAGRTGVPARVAVTITYDFVNVPKGRSIVCAVEAAIEWQRGERLTPRENVLTERPLSAADQKRAPEIAAQMITQSVMEAARGLVAKEELRQGDDAAVLKALDDPDPDVVLWSLELVAERRLAAGFDRALALLEAKDAGVRAAALRALVALRDPRAVEPLAKMANFSNPDELKLVIEAVSAIGGDEAAEFLEYVATGHSDPDLRGRAREGLERIGKRRRGPEPK